MAMISGAASGSCAMGEPHSLQNMRWTALPEVPVPVQLFVGPEMATLSFWNTVTRAARLLDLSGLWFVFGVVGRGEEGRALDDKGRRGGELTISRTALFLTVYAMLFLNSC